MGLGLHAFSPNIDATFNNDKVSVGISLKELGGSNVEVFEILHRDWNLKPIFTQKWASV